MSVPHELQTSALLGHIANQMQLNVAFLESQSYLSPQDVATMKEIIGRLPVQTQAVVTTTTQVRVVPIAGSGARAVPPAPAPAPVITALPKTATVYARATWAYNEDSVEPNDLSFSTGDMIEIVAEKNEDWWLGKVHGKEGLFPSNHVEKVGSTSPATTTITAARPYRPFGAALHGTDTPPSNGGAVNSIGLQQASGQAEKKSKYGALGNTMAHSAAGGVGFGAGAAIGGGLVRAIF
ncbi:SH3-domain-containing protein [Gyrodon lividus]|nr:SH3-domain-containing protein [Gyrodon lividus]